MSDYNPVSGGILKKFAKSSKQGGNNKDIAKEYFTLPTTPRTLTGPLTSTPTACSYHRSLLIAPTLKVPMPSF